LPKGLNLPPNKSHHDKDLPQSSWYQLMKPLTNSIKQSTQQRGRYKKGPIVFTQATAFKDMVSFLLLHSLPSMYYENGLQAILPCCLH